MILAQVLAKAIGDGLQCFKLRCSWQVKQRTETSFVELAEHGRVIARSEPFHKIRWQESKQREIVADPCFGDVKMIRDLSITVCIWSIEIITKPSSDRNSVGHSSMQPHYVYYGVTGNSEALSPNRRATLAKVA